MENTEGTYEEVHRSQVFTPSNVYDNCDSEPDMVPEDKPSKTNADEVRDLIRKTESRLQKLVLVACLLFAAIIILSSVLVYLVVDMEQKYNASWQDLQQRQSNLTKSSQHSTNVVQNDLEQRHTDLTKFSQRNFNRSQNALQQILARLEELMEWYRAKNGIRYKGFKRRANYTVAKTLCSQHQATLAYRGIRDPTVRAELMNLVKFTIGESAWIGLDDRKMEGQFVWEDGAPLKGGEIEWSKYQPDDWKGSEDCANFRKEYNWKANDASCSMKLGFLCEKKIN